MLKKVLMFMLVGVIAVSSVGCSPKETEAVSDSVEITTTNPEELEGEITIWSWDVALEDLRSKSEKFNKTYPNVTFNFEEMGTSQVYSKLTTSLASGIGLPDIVSLEGEQMAKFGTKFPNQFVDLTDIINEDDFLPLKISEVKVNGKILGFPWDAAPTVLFYRNDLFEAAGVDASTITTWDEYIEAGKILNEKTGVKMMSLAESRNDKMYRILMMQQDSFYFDADGNSQVDSPESKKAMECVKKIYDAGITINDISWDDNMIAINEGIVATVPEAIWMVGSIIDAAPETSGDWRVMKLPGFDENAKTGSNGGAAAVIPSASKNKEAAVIFLEFAMTDVDSLVEGFQNYGLYPSYIPAFADDSFNEGLEFFGGQAIYDVANAAAIDMPIVNYTSNFAEVMDIMKNAVNKVLINDEDVEETMNSFQEDLVSKFDK